MSAPTAWFVARSGGEVVGPVPTELIVRGIGEGKVPIEAYVCAAGTKQWKKLPAVREFSTAYHYALVAKDRKETDDLTITYNVAIHAPPVPVPTQTAPTTTYVLWPSGEVHGPFTPAEIAEWNAAGKLADAMLGNGPKGPWTSLGGGGGNPNARLAIMVAAVGVLMTAVGILIGWMVSRS